MALPNYHKAKQLIDDLISAELASSGDNGMILHTSTAVREELKNLSADAVLTLAEYSIRHDPEEAYWACVAELHTRPQKSLFENCTRWAIDISARRRQIAADVLAQLGHSIEKPFAKESWPILEPLLKDPSLEVVESALYACGHLKIGDTALLARYAASPERDIRRATVHALSGRDDPMAIEALIRLSRDIDSDVQNWATFELQMSEVDDPSIRQALFDRLAESDPEIRGEALIGLAKRGDLNVLPPLELELSGEFHGAWCIEAAQCIALPGLAPLLMGLRERMADVDLKAFGEELDQAISACGGMTGDVPTKEILPLALRAIKR